MRVLVTGGAGFIGRHVVRALAARGHTVVVAVRRGRTDRGPFGVDSVACDFGRDVDPATWQARLRGVDAVVNCAGILRERRDASFERVHRVVPVALARAARVCGAGRFIQISALGHPADGPFVATKHQGDAELLQLDLAVTVLRPSLVYAPAGSYGGSSLLRALAALPLVLPVPGDGAMPVQPILADDLAAIVVAALERPEPARGIFEIGGPAAVPLREFLLGLRRWLGAPDGRLLPIAPRVMNAIAHAGEWLGSGPVGLTMWRMTKRGNALAPEQVQRQFETFGVAARSFDEALRDAPCQTQDRWHARLVPLATLLQLGLAAVCLVSAVAGLRMPAHAAAAFAAPLGIAPNWAVALSAGASLLDAVLGLALLWPRAAPAAARWLLAIAIGYTIVLSFAAPALWFDPFGGLVKNLVLVAAILVYLVLADRR